MRKIVAFVGEIGAGKSTAAECLVAVGWKRISFADPLKQMLITMGLTPDDVYGADKEKVSYLLGGKTPRHAMQTLGTEWGRDMIDPNLWVNAWAHAVDQQNPMQHIVVDDARFPNEGKLLQEMGAYITRIERKGHEQKTDHASETYKIPNEYFIYNNGNVLDLQHNVYDLVDDLVSPS